MRTTQLVPSTEHIQRGETWLGGPQYGLQRQHIPGYQGHIHGLAAESVHGKTFAKTSAECLEQRMARGIVQDRDERFATNYKLEFNGPNLRKPQLQTAGERLLEEAKTQELVLNDNRQRTFQSAPKSIQDIPPIDRLPVVGYQGFRPVFMHPLKKVNPPPEPQPFTHPLSTLPPQEAVHLLNIDKDFRRTFERKEPPIVGYTGFMKGLKAENMYGLPYRDISNQIVQNQ